MARGKSVRTKMTLSLVSVCKGRYPLEPSQESALLTLVAVADGSIGVGQKTKLRLVAEA